ncbi:MAG TPA: extracellular solute-binding protein [Alphaproteobacteria bacterium]|nr:extracellular solute-binding protein [Alphaproteobacteria bacterium]HJN61968.1 extracellular solute-binding protein [Alphaproteobacteria bacterium]
MRWLAALLMGMLLLPATLGATLAADADSGGKRHGLSLFGDLKYPPGFGHFEYTDPAAPKGGAISLATTGTFDNLNPFILRGVEAAGTGLPFDSLLATAQDEPDAAYGLIAQSVEVAADRSWVRFVLNPEARWHDGTAITAEDVVFTFETLMAKGHPNYRLLYADVAGVTKLSEREVEFAIENTENRKLPLLIGGLQIISKAYYEAVDFDKTVLTPPLGSGPYRIDGVDPGRSITYSRVDDYWARDLAVNVGRHNFAEMTWDYYRDRTIMVEALKAGEFDWHEEFTSKTWMTAYDLPAIDAGVMVKEVLPDNTPSGVQAFFVNTRRDKFKDPRVRRALSHAFDFEWTNKNIFYGLYDRMASYFENSDLAARGLPDGAELALLEPYRGRVPEEVFAEEFKPPATDGSGRNRRNLREASKLLDAAGWTLSEGARVNAASGEALTLEILYFSPTFERVFGPYARNLERLGITVNLRLVDPSQYIKRLEDHDFDITTRRFVQQLSPGAELWSYFGSASADQRGALNSAGIKDPVVDELIARILAAPDRASMKVAARALDRVLLWGHYIVPQWFKGSHDLVYWNKFARPAILPKYALSLDTWWFDAAKAEKLTAYRKSVN